MINKGTNILTEHKKNRLKFDGELKQINFLDRRVYQREEGVFYPSVTTVLQYMPKNKFFETWLKDVGHNADIIMKRAGEEGTAVHNAVEQLVNGEEVEWMDEYGNARYNLLVWQMILKFADFWTTYKPSLVLSEEFLFSDEFKYAGTADLVVDLGGEKWLIDIKTSNSYHKSFELQVAAYAKAYTEMTGEKIDRVGILWLKSLKRGPSRKEGEYQGKGWELKEVTDIDKNHELFMLIYQLYKLDNEETEPLLNSYPTTVKL